MISLDQLASCLRPDTSYPLAALRNLIVRQFKWRENDRALIDGLIGEMVSNDYITVSRVLGTVRRTDRVLVQTPLHGGFPPPERRVVRTSVIVDGKYLECERGHEAELLAKHAKPRTILDEIQAEERQRFLEAQRHGPMPGDRTVYSGDAHDGHVFSTQVQPQATESEST
jgi:hypothetical protein